MGEEIRHAHFRRRDFQAFEARLREETGRLAEWEATGRFSPIDGIGGFELEAWLIDERGRPAALNDRFLSDLDSPLVVPELARFNVEINTAPRRLEPGALSQMQQDLEAIWNRGEVVARGLGAHLLMIGILPTVTEQDLSLDNISDRVRYRALNEQVLRLRQGAPITLDISGRQPLHAFHSDVMLEAAATSFQIHRQVAATTAARYFNAAVILSAPMVAACANSPYLFGHELWEETRIPLFEEAVSVCAGPAADGLRDRVTFGSGYVRESLVECFVENFAHFAVLLPELQDAPPEQLAHLRLHNGTIWRWNRPLVGFDPDGRPHLRVEHRVVPAGPTVGDSIANAALFFGLVQAMAARKPAPESQLPFAAARDNFYAAARAGLEARIVWLDGRRHALRTLLRKELLPLARAGLAALGLGEREAGRYLSLIEARVETRQTGACWQRRFVERHGPDRAALTLAYLERQQGGTPVHTWNV